MVKGNDNLIFNTSQSWSRLAVSLSCRTLQSYTPAI